MATGREVYIKQDPISNVASKGLLLPGAAKKKENRGTVKYVGPGTESEPMLYAPGDIVKFDQHASIGITIDNEELLMVVDTDIYCKVGKNIL